MAGTAVLLLLWFPRLSPATRQRIKRWWSRRLLDILNVQVEQRGEFPASSSPFLLASNHVSWLDIHLIDSVQPTRFVAKSEIRQWPVAGWVAERAGTVFINRARRHDTGRIAEVIGKVMADGDVVGLFPEGTTSIGEEVRKFHASLLQPAVAAQVPVVPVAIRYLRPSGEICREAAYVDDLSFAQSLGLIIRQRSITARLVIGNPISTQGLHRRDLAFRLEAAVVSQLGTIGRGSRPGTAPDP